MKKLLIIIGVTIGLNTSIVAGPIHEAAKSSDIEEIKSLIDIGVSVDHKDNHGATALFYVRSLEVASYLISIGANVNHQDKVGTTPLMLTEDTQIISVLINNGAEIDAKDFSDSVAQRSTK